MSPLRRSIIRDHHRLLALLRAAIREVTRDDLAGPEAVGRALSDFGRRLRLHLRLEEDVVFPSAEALVQDPTFSVTRQMRCQHQVLRELLADAEAALGRGDRAALDGNLRELEASLELHEQTEERVIYPIADRLLDELDTAGAVAELDGVA